MPACNADSANPNEAAANIINTNVQNLQPVVPTPPTDLTEAFRVLDGVAEVLGLVVDGRDEAASEASAALYARFSAADAVLDILPGTELTRAGQLLEARKLRADLENKRNLVARYQDIALLVERRPPKASAGPTIAESEKGQKHSSPNDVAIDDIDVKLTEDSDEGMKDDLDIGDIADANADKDNDDEMGDDMEDLGMEF